jgi:hypothetical protein
MMRRLKYVSRFAKEMTEAEIDELVSKAAKRNAELQITGALMSTGKLFFQVLEGPSENVELLFRSIQRDARHTDVLLLSQDEGVPERIFPDWSMKRFSLERAEEARLEPLRAILETIVELRDRQEMLIRVLERGVWSSMVKKAQPAS